MYIYAHDSLAACRRAQTAGQEVLGPQAVCSGARWPQSPRNKWTFRPPHLQWPKGNSQDSEQAVTTRQGVKLEAPLPDLEASCNPHSQESTFPRLHNKQLHEKLGAVRVGSEAETASLYSRAWDSLCSHSLTPELLGRRSVRSCPSCTCLPVGE